MAAKLLAPQREREVGGAESWRQPEGKTRNLELGKLDAAQARRNGVPGCRADMIDDCSDIDAGNGRAGSAPASASRARPRLTSTRMCTTR